MSNVHLGENARFSIEGLNKPHSARTWLRKGGHAESLGDARQVALHDLEEAEQKLEHTQAVMDEAERIFRSASRGRDNAYNDRQQDRLAVKQAQEHLAWVCSTDEDE